MATALETADDATTIQAPPRPSTADVLAATLEASRPAGQAGAGSPTFARPDKPVPPRPVLGDAPTGAASSFVKIEDQPSGRRLRPDERSAPREDGKPKQRRARPEPTAKPERTAKAEPKAKQRRSPRGRTVDGPARSTRTTTRAARTGSGHARRTNSIAAMLLGAGVLAGSALGANVAAPGALRLPDAVASALGQPTTSTTVRAGRPVGSTATSALPTTTPGTDVTTTAPAPTTAGSAVATTAPAAGTTAAPTTAPDSTPDTSAVAAVPPPPTPAHPGPATTIDSAPQPTLPGGQAWPTATRDADGTLVVSGVVPSAQAADRLLASLDWYQGPKVNQLTVDPAAASVRYVPVRLTPAPLALPLGNGDLTETEWQVLPLWAKFLVEHPTQHVMVSVNLPTPATPELAAAASNHLSSVEGEILATGASISQVTSRLVPGSAESAPTVEIAVAVDAA